MKDQPRMFEGMDMDLMKRMRNMARNLDLKNRQYRPDNLCPVCNYNTLTVEDGTRCRQCVLAERMK